MADFEKGKPADQSGKVMPFPTIDKVKFYREHLHRSIDSIRDRMAELVNIQTDMCFSRMRREESTLEFVPTLEVIPCHQPELLKDNNDADGCRAASGAG